MRSLVPHLILFVLTILSTIVIGGPIYSIAVMTILLTHEMGHYLASRRYGVPSSLPYFIPLPLPPFGTLGAVIRSKGIIPHRKALFDIGAWGPLFGLSLAVPAVVVGLLLSEVVDASQLPAESLVLGNSPLFSLLQRVTLGGLPPQTDVVLHPIAYAGWVGLFITALNLLPAGQLDGGHIIYSIFGRRSTFIFRLTLGGISLICLIYNVGWLLLVLFLLLIGFKHPPPLDDHTPLDRHRKLTGALAFLIFFTSFTPIPFPAFAMGIQDILKTWLNL